MAGVLLRAGAMVLPAVAGLVGTGHWAPGARPAAADQAVVCDAFCDASTRICGTLRFRSLNGFVTMPPKPPLGKTTWNDDSCSGSER